MSWSYGPWQGGDEQPDDNVIFERPSYASRTTTRYLDRQARADARANFKYPTGPNQSGGPYAGYTSLFDYMIANAIKARPGLIADASPHWNLPADFFEKQARAARIARGEPPEQPGKGWLVWVGPKPAGPKTIAEARHMILEIWPEEFPEIAELKRKRDDDEQPGPMLKKRKTRGTYPAAPKREGAGQSEKAAGRPMSDAEAAVVIARKLGGFICQPGAGKEEITATLKALFPKEFK